VIHRTTVRSKDSRCQEEEVSLVLHLGPSVVRVSENDQGLYV
jgi:hypothetical protein